MKKKIILIITLLFTLLCISLNNCYAADITTTDIFEKGDNFISGSGSAVTPINEDTIKPLSTTIYNILLSIGIAVAAVFALILGIQFIIGSMEEKAEVKERLLPFVFGCIVIFGAFGIWKLIVNIAQGAF